MRINLGCASTLLDDYINVDMDSLDTIKSRYPNLQISEKLEFLQSDIFSLPFEKKFNR